jgi:hypothetical protein
VSGALHQFGMKDIIGAHVDAQEFLVQLFHDMGVVVDALQEDGLVAQGNAGFGQAAAGGQGIGSNFLGMVENGYSNKGVMFFQHITEVLGDALGHGDGGAAADALDLHMGYIIQFRQDPVDAYRLRVRGSPPVTSTSRISSLARM